MKITAHFSLVFLPGSFNRHFVARLLIVFLTLCFVNRLTYAPAGRRQGRRGKQMERLCPAGSLELVLPRLRLKNVRPLIHEKELFLQILICHGQ